MVSRIVNFILGPILLFFVSSTCKGQPPSSSVAVRPSFNLSFEKLDSSRHPLGWGFALAAKSKHFEMRLDSTAPKDGRYSVVLERIDTVSVNPNEDYAICYRMLPVPTMGDSVEFSGWIRTEGVDSGVAGIMLRVQTVEGRLLSFDNMMGQKIKGTRGWARYSAKLPMDLGTADSMFIGGFLLGGGKAWFDDLRVTIYGQTLDSFPLKRSSSDTNYTRYRLGREASAHIPAELTPVQVVRLTDLGMLWGFLKYYHPAVNKGAYDMDSALFCIVPRVLAAANDGMAHKIEEDWVDRMGRVAACATCHGPAAGSIVQAANYGYLFEPGRLSAGLQQKLAFIRDNHVADDEHYYITYGGGAGNAIFRNEDKFAASRYPLSAIRLLSVYRYWNDVQYFFPNRHLITEDWNTMLGLFIPRFIRASNTLEYLRACSELIGHIHDSHAGVGGYHPVLEALKGSYRMPFDAVFAEGKLVVTRHFVDSPDLRQVLPVGSVIRSIDGVTVDSLVRRALPWTTGSNYTAQLRDMSGAYGFLLRGTGAADLEVEDGNMRRKLRMDRVSFYGARHVSVPGSISGDRSFLMLEKGIGYIDVSKLKEGDMDSIRVQFAQTKGVIFDMRHYPSQSIPFSGGSWLKATSSPFVVFSQGDLSRPGTFVRGAPMLNGGGQEIDSGQWNALGKGANCYKGHVILIVNEGTQSSGEYQTMALQSAPGALVIGSATAGADGNVSTIDLPGNVNSWISGIGVYYPDGRETQRVGVRIDRPLQVTIKGIREGRDELLEAAKRLIRE